MGSYEWVLAPHVLSALAMAPALVLFGILVVTGDALPPSGFTEALRKSNGTFVSAA